MDTSPVVTGFEWPGSVNTSGVVAGFGGGGHWLGRSPASSHGHARGLQIGTGRLPTDARGRLDAPERPPEAPQCDDLLLVFVVQDIAHAAA